jgi:hypothetical protein
MSAVIAWLMANWGMIATVLLGISEALAVVFPSSTGFGGILAGIIKFLQGLGAQPPAPPAA